MSGHHSPIKAASPARYAAARLPSEKGCHHCQVVKNSIHIGHELMCGLSRDRNRLPKLARLDPDASG
jgi:hypothetical protein